MTDDRELDEAIRQLPRTIDPPEDLWVGIQARVDARTRFRRRALVVGVLAAAAAVALWVAMAPSRALGPELDGGWTAAVAPGLAVEPATPTVAPDAAPPSELIPGEAQLRGAATELARAYDERRPLLDRELLAVYEENLGIVDDAIERSRAALVERPTDPHLQRVLDRAYRHKLALLRRASSVEASR